mmetsp:Transcript_24362/g.87015  ORF Transcript_24362/g.87015 Transcript_24362/m.87015 type:complete len:508 (+) Transcript_24362:144-1667(+)
MRVLAFAALRLAAGGPDVVYLLADDMRADWGAYGLETAQTPHFDALAKDALLFANAYCQISVCSPSRQSFLHSLRPDTFRVWNFLDANPLSAPTTPGWFRDHGYLALGLGKTFHEKRGAWNADAIFNTSFLPYYLYEDNECVGSRAGEGGGHCVLADEDIYDYRLRLKTLDYLDAAVEHKRDTSTPFFLLCGFRDPHAPWVAPKRMYDLYTKGVLPPLHDTLAPGVPLISWSNELDVLANDTSYAYGPYKAVPKAVQLDQRLAYYAAVSYVDEHVGAVVQKLKTLGLYESTLLVSHSDHGYLLGEHGLWEKKSNFDLAVRVPLLIKAPGKAFGKTHAILELVDVFPTLSNLAGLPPPPGVEGSDVSSLFDESLFDSGATSLDTGGAGKRAAYHQYPACSTPSFNSTRAQCNEVPRAAFDFMAYSVRTADWRYTLWLPWDGSKLEPIWDGSKLEPIWEGGKFADELYDHASDDSTSMDRFENANVASRHADVSLRLRNQLRDFFASQT